MLHIKVLKALARRESQAWQGIDSLIQMSKPKACDETVEMVRQLWDLVIYKEKEGAFRERVNQIYKQYGWRSGLMRRLQGVGFP